MTSDLVLWLTLLVGFLLGYAVRASISRRRRRAFYRRMGWAEHSW